jgi:hypothetical protein
MGIGQTVGRNRFILVGLAAALFWTAAASSFFPLREAASAIWRDAPKAAEQLAMFNVADKSFWACMQQRPSAGGDADIGPARARESHCNSLKDFLYGQTVGMPRDRAWGHVRRFAAVALTGALGIAAFMLIALWAARRPGRTGP